MMVMMKMMISKDNKDLILSTARVSTSATFDSCHGDVDGVHVTLACAIVLLCNFLGEVAVSHSQIAMAKVGFPIRSTNRIIIVRAGFRTFFNTAMSKAARTLNTFVICGLANLSLDTSLFTVWVATEVFTFPIMQLCDISIRDAGCIVEQALAVIGLSIRATDRFHFFTIRAFRVATCALMFDDDWLIGQAVCFEIFTSVVVRFPVRATERVILLRANRWAHWPLAAIVSGVKA